VAGWVERNHMKHEQTSMMFEKISKMYAILDTHPVHITPHSQRGVAREPKIAKE